MTEWNKDLEKKILRKSRFALTFRILRVLLIVLFLYAVYMILINIIVDKLHVGYENKYFSSLALEWTVPNVRSDYDIKNEDLSIFGTKTFSYDLLKMVGDESIVIGEAQVTKKLSDRQSWIKYNYPGRKYLSEFSFSLPEDPRTGRKLGANTSPHVWDTLQMLPEGTVGELAFSTTEFMESADLIKALNDYDLHILWMPLYTGEFINYDPSNYSWSDNTLMVHEFGLTGGRDHNEFFRDAYRIRWLDEETIAESEQLMLKNMEKLLQKPERYYKNFLGLWNLEERYQFLKEEGFIVYGAVVTGPVKELLKLQDLPFIQGEQLGEVELWNWQQRSN